MVKSPPELWAELSDATSLARHLADFGEIRITRIEPETAVAWEGEHARGTVRLEPSGWGTRVVLTIAGDDAGEPEPEGASPDSEAPAAPTPVPPSPLPDPSPPAPAPVPDPPAPLHDPVPTPDPEPLPPAARAPRARALLARLLRFIGPEPARVPRNVSAAVPPPTRRAEPPNSIPPPATAAASALTVENSPASESPRAADTAPAPRAPAAVSDDSPLTASLSAALDSLGQAHHRPFSRP